MVPGCRYLRWTSLGGMAGMKLTAAMRKKISSSEYGLPEQRKYPMPDRSHAANAKARATQQVEKGNLSADQAAKD